MALVIDMNTRAVVHASGKDEPRSGARDLTPKARPAEEDLRLELNVSGTVEASKTWVPGLLPDVDGDQTPPE